MVEAHCLGQNAGLDKRMVSQDFGVILLGKKAQ
jgi:hypothetical protein